MRAPAMANAHSHAFQRGLRGRAERVSKAGDDFWSWREAMYSLAGELDPASLEEASRAAYDEMAAAGYGAVGEFHYVHHRPDGTPYDDPNAMAKAAARAARAAAAPLLRPRPGGLPRPRRRAAQLGRERAGRLGRRGRPLHSRRPRRLARGHRGALG
jgi:cytosine/adenosine deaminase-related metal-dependent hydrolase